MTKSFFLCIHKASGERQEDVECAELNSTRWQGYRQQRPKLEVQYLLLTRKNPDCAQRFDQDYLSKPTSYFNTSCPTKVIVHGYRALGRKPSWVTDLAQALLRAQDVNVVVVDWIYGASFAYNLVVENYKEVALQISVLINRLQVRETTVFMFAIHTDSDYLGISIPVGHVDFFLNGGMDQTGCARSRFATIFLLFPVYGYVICDHMRAVHVYMSALNGTCPLMGIPCFSYEDFLQGSCVDCEVYKRRCPTIGLQENSGIATSPIPGQQKVFLLTTSSSPFCAHHILLRLEVSPLDKSAEVEVTLLTWNEETVHRFRLQTATTVYRRVLAHPAALCQIDTIRLKNTGARLYRQGDLHIKSVCISELPLLRCVHPLCVNNIDIRRGVLWSHDFVQVCGTL
uniref:Phospholipase A1 member A n=1 Tax=Fundulus heteroclitus TaxID=8078 RepID=A0A3Q2PL77_FUNHE